MPCFANAVVKHFWYCFERLKWGCFMTSWESWRSLTNLQNKHCRVNMTCQAGFASSFPSSPGFPDAPKQDTVHVSGRYCAWVAHRFIKTSTWSKQSSELSELVGRFDIAYSILKLCFKMRTDLSDSTCILIPLDPCPHTVIGVSED